MTQRRSTILRFILRSAALLIALNEVRGIILAAPVFYAMYQAGGTMMALWLGASSLMGIALSVIIPLFAVKRLEAKFAPKAA